jgi:hypothetical protein
MPIAAVGRLVGEHDRRLWRVIRVEDAVARRVATDEPK